MSDSDDDRWEAMEADEMAADRHAEEIAERDERIAALRKALTEALDAWRDLVQTTTQFPTWQQDPDAIRIAELRKLTEET
jgi:hypothetical protein